MSEYTLALSEAEIGRYQMMARQAVAREASQLAVAGVVAGATVADIGCGPAAMSIELARLVSPSGQVIAVERDKQALQPPPRSSPSGPRPITVSWTKPTRLPQAWNRAPSTW